MRFLRNTWAVLQRELVRMTHQPMYLTLMLVLPLLSFAFFALLFNQGVARNIPIAILDEDHTTLSRKVAQMIADHGNADNALNPDGTPNTAHSLNPVPIVVVSDRVRSVRNGILADVAPTVLKLMGLPQPSEMTGRPLVEMK